nr:FAD-dependent oxidoreductase [Alicyclobacillus sp. TC]
MPDDGNLHAHRFMDALRIAVHHFASVLEQTEILRVEKTADCFRVYTHQDTSFEAERLVLAAGAFATSLLRSLELSIDIHPVKGQMMAIRPRDLQLQHTVFSQHAYLVPKRDGKIVVGATEEREAGYDKSPSSDSLAWLLYSLKRIAPVLAILNSFIHGQVCDLKGVVRHLLVPCPQFLDCFSHSDIFETEFYFQPSHLKFLLICSQVVMLKKTGNHFSLLIYDKGNWREGDNYADPCQRQRYKH